MNDAPKFTNFLKETIGPDSSIEELQRFLGSKLALSGVTLTAANGLSSTYKPCEDAGGFFPKVGK